MTVAVFGSGRMGAAMAGRLAGAGTDLVLYNRTRDAAEAVAAATSAKVAATAREAADSAEVCLVSLADDAALLEMYCGDDGLVAGLRPGTVVCETSTVHAETVKTLAPLVAERGATLLDCPVSGSVPLVERGELTVMVGGDEGSLDRVRPVLETFASRVFHLGDVGAGAATKLVVQALLQSLNAALSEALVLAEKAGLDRETTYDVFEAGAAGAPYVLYKRSAFLSPEETPVAFSLDLVAKDQQLVHRLASEAHARMDQADATRRLVAEAVEAGLGDRDMSALAQFLR
jgi:3-hydroxyisobutyrate dehydrogenase/2-hydroxy-3-oxopropionate reductase